ncbi:caspase family protein [Microcoleus sp. T2B6]|uniref:caspase family protein n=1 Tax=Microcoleus sp. T2B6 TaxID=3055424 RepID=UPI002FCE79CA
MSNFEHSYALIIGINDYKNGISALKTAVSDATEIARILETEHDYTVTLLLNQAATLSQLRQVLEIELPKQIQAGDRFLFYFAGHGIALNGEDGPEGCLIPQNAKLGNVRTYLPMSDVNKALLQLPCRHFLGILDCCFAGAFRWSSLRKALPVELVTIHKERYDRFIQDPAWQVLTSAAYDQSAWDAFDLKDDRGQIGSHSPFASALIEALEGKADAFPPAEPGKPAGDGVITATDLYVYLRDRVEVATEARAIRQTPGIHCLNKHDKGEYIFLTPGHALNLPPAPPLDVSKNPYRGLLPFEEEHNKLFFGRNELIEKLQNIVQTNPLTVVLGASGCGKSSLAKAGLIPKLKQQKSDKWFIISPIRPGATPFQALNNALIDAQLPKIELQNQQKTLSQSIAVWAKNHPDSHLLIFIDKSEEIITLCQDEDERPEFFQQILTAIDAHRDKLRVVLSLRSDFETQLRDAGLKCFPTVLKKEVGNTDTELKERWLNGRFIVPAMTRAELREAIEKPAEARVMYFQPHDLVEQLINEVADMPGALPLLSFALRELYLKYLKRQRDAQNRGITIDRALTQEDYQALGGVIQSLTQRADEEYQALVQENPAYSQVIRHVMLRMVALAGGELARRQVPLSELEYPPARNSLVKEVIEHFSTARLLVKGQDAEGNPYVEPAHDALVRGWQKLLNWVEEEKNLRLQRRLIPAAVEWKSQQQPRYLWNTDPYLDVLQKEVLNSQNNNWLNQLETEFVQQSIRQKHKDTRSRWGIGITVSLVITTFVASATTFVGTVWSNLTSKPNVIFASPEQEIQGTTDYRYLYTPDTAKKPPYPTAYNQILMGFSTKSEENKVKSKDVPGCINVDQLGDKGEKIQAREHFTIKAPKEPGVYYVKFRSAFEYSCDNNSQSRSAKQRWESGDYLILEKSNIGIVVVGNVLNFPYPDIWEAYSNNVINQNTSTGDENQNSGIYLVLRNFKFHKK